MQTISQNAITQRKHGVYNAVDIGPSPDPYYYAPEDGIVTLADVIVGDTNCGKRLKLKGSTGEHGFCHNELIYVKVGQKVKRGQKLAKMGYTGLTDPDNVPAGTHVHWILNINGVWIYPPSKVNQLFIKLGDTMTLQQKKDLALGEKARKDNYQGRLKADQKAILAGIKAHLNDSAFKAEVRKLVK
jgi:hypothetical protein